MLRFAVRVKPGAARARVGGTYGADVLVVAVAARPVEGAANRAVIAALAAAFDVPRTAVEIVAGASSRTKTVVINGPDQVLAARLAELLEPGVRRGQ